MRGCHHAAIALRTACYWHSCEVELDHSRAPVMRFLVVADLHYSLPQFDWLLSVAPQFDLVIFAGDALDTASVVDFRAQILVVRKYLALLSGETRIILCSANHDLDD